MQNCDGTAAQLHDQLTGALIGLARATDGNEHLISPASTAIVVESLANTEDSALEKLLQRVKAQKREMIPDCFTCAAPCGKNNDYDMADLLREDAQIRELKLQLLSCIRIAAADARRAAGLGRHDDSVNLFFYKALIAIGMDGWQKERLLPIVQEAEEIRRIYAEMIEK